jgi:hypothetical protein
MEIKDDKNDNADKSHACRPSIFLRLGGLVARGGGSMLDVG